MPGWFGPHELWHVAVLLGIYAHWHFVIRLGREAEAAFPASEQSLLALLRFAPLRRGPR